MKPTSPKHAGSAIFGECADRVIEAMKPAWRNQKHKKQWETTLRLRFVLGTVVDTSNAGSTTTDVIEIASTTCGSTQSRSAVTVSSLH
jgi:hypothetical protein